MRTLPAWLGILALIAWPNALQAAPDGAEEGALLLSACEDPGDFSAARTPDDPAFDFAAWQATVFAGARVQGNSLRWHLRPSSTQQTSARLALTRIVAGPLSDVSVWVKNPNAHEVTLRLEVLDADGARYASPPVALADEIGWRELTFELRALTGPATDPCPGLDAPFTRVALLLEGLVADRPHTIYLDEMTARTNQLAPLAVTDLRCQTSLGPGEQFGVHARLSPASAVPDAGVVVQIVGPGGGVLAQAPVRVDAPDGASASVGANLRMPAWLAPGCYEVRLAAGFGTLTGAEPIEVVVGGSPVAPGAAEIVAGLTPPAIRLGADAWPPVIEELRGDLPAQLDANARIVALPATADAHPFAWAAAVAEPEAPTAFAGLDRRAAGVLNERPESARSQIALVLQVFLNATPEWLLANPQHLQLFDGGTLAPPAVVTLGRALPDIASDAWQREAEQRLRALVRHVEASPWGHRVVGYELQAGDLGAWRPWGASLGIGDESTPVRRDAFLDWLHGQYPSVNDLRNGWLGRRRGFGRPRAGFEAVELPEPLADQPEPSLYDPSADQPMIDLQFFRAETAADALLRMARAIRDEAHEGTLVGGCYGHLLAQARANDWSWPHTALSRVLASGSVDFLTGPQQRIDDVTQPSSLGESARRAGVLYLERPNGADAVAEDCGALMPAGGMASLTRIPAPVAPGPGATVIEVIDDLSARYLSGDAALPRELLTRPIAGAIEHQSCLLGDLLGPNPPQGSVYIFRDLFAIEPEQGRLLGRNTARDGSLLVWVYAPGAVDQYLITGRTMQYLTGIKLSPMVRRGRLKIAAESSQLDSFGFRDPVSPWFASVDEDAEWLGAIEGTELCGFALRKFPYCTSVFAAAPPSERVLRHLAQRSGIEIAPSLEQ